MPIYEYRCEECGHQFDKLQKISDEPLKDCPQCKAPALKKLISAAGFQLKGDGWYVTDFKDKKGAKPEAKSGNSEKSNAESKSESASKSTASGSKKDDS